MGDSPQRGYRTRRNILDDENERGIFMRNDIYELSIVVH